MTGREPNAGLQWQALSPDAAVHWLSPLTVAWWVAGGWALDLHVGMQTRPHGDLDIGILRRDAVQVLAQLTSWEFFEAKNGVLTRLHAGQAPRADVNSLWCRLAGNAQWTLELLLDDSAEDRWVFRRERRIQRPLTTVIRRSLDGIPYLAPEIQLLYKSRPIRARDHDDFAVVAPRLDADARAWLRDALTLMDPHHRWLAAITPTAAHFK